jgi:hypothetical protein
VSNRTSHPEPGVPSGASIAAPRPPRVSSAARLPPCAPALSALQILSASNPACLKPDRQAASARRENRRLFVINVTRARSRPTRSGNVT